MVYPHSYINKILVLEIDEKYVSLSETVDDKFCRDALALNTHSAGKIALDLENKNYCNSAELGALIKLKDMMFDEDMELVLIKPSTKILELFEIVGVEQFFTIVMDDEELE